MHSLQCTFVCRSINNKISCKYNKKTILKKCKNTCTKKYCYTVREDRGKLN